MTLFSLALQNVKRNFKSYFLYFASMIFSIVIYYTFTSLQYNTQIQEAAEVSKKISGAFKLSGVMLILFVAIFIVYSNSFFTRKRKKEVGLYSLLGMRKKQIGKMLFYENLCMGAIALGTGVLAGALLSKLFLGLLIKLMGLHINVAFEVSFGAVMQTLIVFVTIILYTSVQGYRLIYRFKLIELFHAERQGEKAPKSSLFIAALSLVFIGIGYVMALLFMQFAAHLDLLLLAFLILFFTVTGTYILFHFFSIAVLKRARNNKRSFYHGMNIVSTSQLFYRIKGNATTLASIAVLSAVTLCAVGFAATMYYDTFTRSEHMRPFSYSYVEHGKALNKKVQKVIDSEEESHPVTKDVMLKTVFAKGSFEGLDYVRNMRYMIDEGFYLMSETNFHQYMKNIGREENVKLASNETFAVDGYYEEQKQYKPYENTMATLTTGNKKTKLMVKGVGNYFLSNLEELILIVPDAVYKEAESTSPVRIVRNIDVEDERNSQALSEKIGKIVENTEEFNDYYRFYKEMLEDSGMMIFIGGFLGLVFLLATGSIIYFKQLTEATADRPQYNILRKVGVTTAEMKKAIRKQMAFVFSAPLIVGVLHSLIALKALGNLMSIHIILPVTIGMIVYVVMYFGYYVLTVRSYFNTVR